MVNSLFFAVKMQGNLLHFFGYLAYGAVSVAPTHQHMTFYQIYVSNAFICPDLLSWQEEWIYMQDKFSVVKWSFHMWQSCCVMRTPLSSHYHEL